jgi:sporulation protein YlmC with PRC-barrel domain
MIRANHIAGATVVTEGGRRVGRVHEVRLERGQVTALLCGKGGLLQRLAATHGGIRVKWDDVLRIEGRTIVVRERR